MHAADGKGCVLWSQPHACKQIARCSAAETASLQAWELVQHSVPSLTNEVATVCLASLDGRFQTHAVRLMVSLLTAVEVAFHGEQLA